STTWARKPSAIRPAQRNRISAIARTRPPRSDPMTMPIRKAYRMNIATAVSSVPGGSGGERGRDAGARRPGAAGRDARARSGSAQRCPGRGPVAGPREVEARPVLEAEGPELQPLAVLLDPLRDDLEAQRPPERDDGTGERPVLRAAVGGADELARDLQD